MEKWKLCNDTNTYEISNHGRVRNRRTGRILRTHINTQGYECVQLRYPDGVYTKRVHRLVAEAFHDGEYYGMDVNHIDGNKLNNHADNLEWCDRSKNIRHAFDIGLKNSDHRKRRVRIVETGEEFDSLTECGKAIGRDRTMIAACLNGRTKTCAGYHFERLD